MQRRTFVSMMLALPVAGFVGVSCGGGDTGIRLVDADEAADYLFESPPADLVVLDVRTPDEYAGGRLPDAQLLDFYRSDFADRLESDLRVRHAAQRPGRVAVPWWRRSTIALAAVVLGVLGA